MSSPVEATLILCDAAQADPSGKMHMLGAGWSMTGSPTAPSAVAVMLKVPWDRTNEQITLHLHLCDADGRPVTVAAPEGQEQVEVAHRGNLEVGRPPGVPAGSAIDAAFAVNVPPLPLPPGRYQWRLDVGNDFRSAEFTVRAD